MKRCKHLLAVLAFAVLSAGCGDSSSGPTAAGTLQLDGAPLEGATVQFWPKDDLTLGVYYSDGTSDAEGRFRLKGRDGPALKPGRYVVLVKRLVNKDGSLPTAEEARADPRKAWKNSLPELYSDKTKTPHQAVEITPGHNDLPALVLKSKP